MIAALDTNILAYAEGINGPEKKAAALELIQRLPPEATLLPAQVLGELVAVLVRKARRSRSDARAAMLSWGDVFPLIDTSGDVLIAAADLSTDHQLSIWDSVILASAADAGCRLLLSEDLQDGFTWGGVTVTNPFATPRHALLSAWLESPGKRPLVRSADL